MRNGSWVLGIGTALAVAMVGCGGDKCVGADCAGAVESFTLQYCTSGEQCRDGMTCLPTSEDACQPNADGTAGDCENRGICMPPPDVGNDDPEGGTDPNTGEPRPGDGTTGGTYCFAETWGDPTACQGDMDWAIQALAACNARGATLIDLHVLLSCPGGLPGGAVFTCCTFGEAPIEPPPEPEPPQPGECVEMPFPADPGMDPREMARHLCGGMNLEIADIMPLDFDEAGNVMTWMAICCGEGVPVDPEPQPEECVEIGLRYEPTSASDPKSIAAQHCADMGLELRGLEIRSEDPATGLATLIATCCRTGEPIDPGPGPDPYPCEGAFEVAAGNGECDAAIDLKEAAWRQCQETGAELVDLQVRLTCDNGMPGALVATCCPAEGTVPPDPPDPGRCVTMEGQPDSAGEWPCRDEPGWKEWAWAQCDAMNLALADLMPFEECENGGFRFARFTCCG